jgi:uncharacterized protein
VTPFFFGPRARQLYGVLHEPQTPGSEGILLCQAGPQQAMRLTWLVRYVAGQLAAAGFPALRFDYFATGDSSGDSDAATLQQWREDVLTAADELRDRCGVSKVSAIGLRLGATLFASCAGLQLSHALLWEPVIDGRAYVRELKRIQRDRYENDPLGQVAPEDELLGFPFSARRWEELLALDLRSAPHCTAARWTLLAASDNSVLEDLARTLRAEGNSVAVVVDPSSRDPSPQSIDSLLYSTGIANALVNALRQAP